MRDIGDDERRGSRPATAVSPPGCGRRRVVCVAAAALCTIALPLFAQSTSFQLHGFLSARAIAVSSQPPWTERGFGEFDVGSQTDGKRRTVNLDVAQLGVDWTPTTWLLIHADGIARREPAGTVGRRAGLVQAFADVYTEHLRFRAGSFWLPTSRENVEPLWTSRYTITYSALNSWIAQEVRPLGADLQFSPNFYVTAGATAFRGNETMGTALAARGWTFGNRLTTYDEEIAVPPPDGITRPVHYSSDSRVGFAGRLRVQLPERAMLQFAHVDNRSELYVDEPPNVPWNTRFNIISGEIGSTSPTTVAAEWLYGRTAVAIPGGSFTVDFDTAYILASRKSGSERFTTRYERFSTRAHKRWPNDYSRETGHALTFAWLHDVGTHWRTGIEYAHVTGERPVLPNPSLDGSTWTAEVRLGF